MRVTCLRLQPSSGHTSGGADVREFKSYTDSDDHVMSEVDKVLSRGNTISLSEARDQSHDDRAGASVGLIIYYLEMYCLIPIRFSTVQKSSINLNTRYR